MQIALQGLCAMLALAAGGRPGEQADIERLQGRWQAVSGTFRGKPLPKAEIAGVTLVVSGLRLCLMPNINEATESPDDGKDIPSRIDLLGSMLDFRIDASKTPKHLDIPTAWSDGPIVPQGAQGRMKPVYLRCIYRLENDRLTICWGAGGARPRGFVAKPGEDFSRFVYQRVAEAPSPPSPAAGEQWREHPVFLERRRYAETNKARAERLRPRERAWYIVQVMFSEDPKARDAARSLLWKAGRDGELAAAMADAVRGDLCAQHLAWLARQVEPGHVYARLVLEKFRSHEEARVRSAFLEAIARTAIKGCAVPPEVLEALRNDPDVEVRRAVLRVLGQIGPPAGSAAPAVQAVLAHRSIQLRLEAVACLRRIQPENRSLMQDLDRLEGLFRRHLADALQRRAVAELQSLIAEQAALGKKIKQAHRAALLKLCDWDDDENGGE